MSLIYPLSRFASIQIAALDRRERAQSAPTSWLWGPGYRLWFINDCVWWSMSAPDGFSTRMTLSCRCVNPILPNDDCLRHDQRVQLHSNLSLRAVWCRSVSGAHSRLRNPRIGSWLCRVSPYNAPMIFVDFWVNAVHVQGKDVYHNMLNILKMRPNKSVELASKQSQIAGNLFCLIM